MSEEILFGVGCFHFWLVKEPPFTFDLETYVKALDETLQLVPTITNIELDHDDPSGLIEVSKALALLHEGQDFVPHPVYLEIRFDVYIPFRIQKELYEGELEPEVFTENFRVEIHYAYHAPVCFVEPINPMKQGNPSDAIRVVRDYLELEINNLNTEIKFDVLGPSPFHANFSSLPKRVRTTWWRSRGL